MKKLFALSILLSCLVFAQESNQQNLLYLKNEVRKSSESFVNESNFTIIEEKTKKNVGLAVVYSLLLPGMGELYAESYSSGKYFTIAEGALWAAYIGVNTYGNWQKDRYKSFAASNGGVNPEGKDDDYFGTIGEYLNIEQFNNEKALERNFADMLDAKQFYWKWTSEDRKTYRSMWVSSEQAFNNLRFVVGGLIINRLISAINAVRLTVSYNKRQAEELGWNISAGVENSINLPNQFTINIQTHF
jgi:hypothetical protein